MSNFWQRAFTGLAFIVVMLLSILFSPKSFLVMLTMVTFLASLEYFKLQNKGERSFLLNLFNALFTVAIFLLFEKVFKNELESKYLVFMFLPFVYLLAVSLFKKKEELYKNAFVLLGAVFIFSLPFSILYSLSFTGNSMEFNPVVHIIPLFLMVWANDTFAYLGGKFLGRHKLMPKVSPNKTVEGFVSGLLFCFIVSLLYDKFMIKTERHPLVFHVLSGILIGSFSTLGDLVQSATKRKAGVKDSGKLLPGHGGVWDRFDGFVFAVPVYAILIYTLT
jgi:phosphatidate cytidylyltransferase